MVNPEKGPSFEIEKPEEQGEKEEKEEWKKRIEEETGEPYEVSSIRALLEVIADGVKTGYVTSPENVHRLTKEIEELRRQGVDLSAIDNLDQRVEELRREAPRVAIKSSLEKAQKFRGEKDERTTLLSWYFGIRDKLEKYRDLLEPEEIEETEKELDKIAQELGL